MIRGTFQRPANNVRVVDVFVQFAIKMELSHLQEGVDECLIALHTAFSLVVGDLDDGNPIGTEEGQRVSLRLEAIGHWWAEQATRESVVALHVCHCARWLCHHPGAIKDSSQVK